MDAVYPLGGIEKFANIELLFSLRMLDKFVEGIDNVYVIGDDPKFLKANVIPFEENGVKNYRIAKKVEFACGLKEISDDFLFCNDDHFIMKPFVASEFPYYHKGELINEEQGLYNGYLNDTGKFLEELGKPHNHFDVHCPIVYNKAKFMELATFWQQDRNLVVKSMYANYHGIEGQFYVDHKLKHLSCGEDLGRITENECFSVYDCAMENGILQYLCNNFSQPSRFEKENIRFELLPLKTFNDTKEGCLRRKKEVFSVDNDRAMDLIGKRPEMFKIISIG